MKEWLIHQFAEIGGWEALNHSFACNEDSKLPTNPSVEELKCSVNSDCSSKLCNEGVCVQITECNEMLTCARSNDQK